MPAGAILESEVAEHDPAHAVFGGADGMAVIGPIARLAGGWLKPGGCISAGRRRLTAEGPQLHGAWSGLPMAAAL